MKHALFIFYFAMLSSFVSAQNYTSYVTGNTTDTVVAPQGGICLMGGAMEDDNAMKWFLQRANGGDVLVLRASGSDGYNNYLYSGLGISVNSVETIVFHNAMASQESYILQRIHQAEAIWFAGGNQWTYVDYWRDSPIDSAINVAVQHRRAVIGGTSAGMAILGQYYFSAENGTVTSAAALDNPYDHRVTVDSTAFLDVDFMQQTIADTHFDNPDRKGRLVGFMARIFTDYGADPKGIACDEYTAVCIDTNGIASVYGGHPAFDDNAYFVQVNCEHSVQTPEVIAPNTPLTWDLNGEALKVYRIKGDSTGTKTFNLNNWEDGNGGEWFNWSVNNGVFSEQSDSAINCSGMRVKREDAFTALDVYPNPTTGRVTLKVNGYDLLQGDVTVYNPLGQQINIPVQPIRGGVELAFDGVSNGIYIIYLRGVDERVYRGRVVKY